MFLPFRKASKSITVGLDIGASLIKLAQLERRGNKVVLTKLAIVEAPLGSMDKGKIMNPKALGEAINQTIKVNGFRQRDVVMGLPGRSVIIRQVRLPLMESEELQETLKWEKDRYLPLPLNESIVDFHILQRFTEINPPEMEVVLVGVNEETINKCLEVAQEAEIVLKAIEVTTFAFLKSINSDNIPGTIVVLNMSNLDLEMMILHNGLLRFSRVIPSAPSEDLLREIQRSIDFHKIQNREEVVEKIILAGTHPELTGLAQSLAQELGVNVEKANPFILVNPAPAFDQNYLEQVAPMLGVSIGLALRTEK